MHQKAKITFICDDAMVRHAVLSPLSHEFQIYLAPHDGQIPPKITDYGYHDIWLIDHGVNGRDAMVAHIMDNYGTMGAKIIMIGGGEATQNDVIGLEKPIHITNLKKIIRDCQSKGEKYKTPILLKDNIYIHYAQNKVCRDTVCVDMTKNVPC